MTSEEMLPYMEMVSILRACPGVGRGDRKIINEFFRRLSCYLNPLGGFPAWWAAWEPFYLLAEEREILEEFFDKYIGISVD